MMIYLGGAGLTPDPGSVAEPEWGDNETIKYAVMKQFPKQIQNNLEERFVDIRFPFCDRRLQHMEANFPSPFTLEKMSSFSGFKMQGTNNLADHLYFERFSKATGEPTIYVFHNVAFLKELKRNG